jgi:hypothetical protein
VHPYIKYQSHSYINIDINDHKQKINQTANNYVGHENSSAFSFEKGANKMFETYQSLKKYGKIRKML